jgi:hypothetical protein
MNICKFCEQNVSKLVDSHIIPRAFFEYTKAKSKVPRSSAMEMVTNVKSEFPIRDIRIGFYDSGLVCLSCEQKFKIYDDYAIKLLLQEEDKQDPIVINNTLTAWKINNYDYEKLGLFFISVLWRAGASTLPVFEKIKLGSYLQKAKEAIESGNLDNRDYFSFLIARFTDSIGLSVIPDPHLEIKGGMFESVNVYRFYLGAGYNVFIKVDQRKFPHPANSIAASSNHPLIILKRGDFDKVKEGKVLLKLIGDADDALKRIRSK